VSVLLGSGTGTFGTKSDYAVGVAPYSVITGDFNGDGKTDIATANRNTNNVSVLLGSGTGTFGTKSDYTVGSGPISLTSGDFNGDGKTDIATANNFTNNISILLGNVNGTFGTKTDYTIGNAPSSIITGDFNGDGKADLAVIGFDATTTLVNVSILLGTGSGTFTFGVKRSYNGGGWAPVAITTGDFNSDGKTDLAVANANYTVSILIGTGNGTFGANTDYSVGAAIRSITTGDFNGDGKTDIATANSSNNTISILLNQTFDEVKTTAHTVLTTALATYTEANYTTTNWAILTGFKTTGDSAIDAAQDLTTVNSAKTTAINGMASVKTIAQEAKAITAFTIPNQRGTTTIDQVAHTIAITMPYGTNVTALVPTITITGTSVSPLSGTSRNFTNPQTYTVTAQDSSTQPYIVTVTVNNGITSSAGSNGTITPLGDKEVALGTDQAFIIEPAPTYHVADVLVDGVSVEERTNYTFNNVTANHTIHAIFAINQYAVNFDLGLHGTLKAGETLNQTVNHGSGATAPIFDLAPGWAFSGWDLAFDNVTTNLNVTAQYSIVTYTVNFTAGENGTITGTKEQTVNHGTNCTEVIAVANPGYKFDSWTGDYSGTTNKITITNVTANMTITANFAVLNPSVVSAKVFYNNSAWDENNAEASLADDLAIATDKVTLLSGTATFANYTSYDKGINGIMINISDLPGTPTAADFTFKVGNSNTPSGWADAPAPTTVTTRDIGGNVTRVTLIWADNAIKKTWLQVTVGTNSTTTGLTTPYVFYFGNAPGDCGNSP
ncbi:MAG: FG-GAP-like repeat-containing protein, partial [bacterium]